MTRDDLIRRAREQREEIRLFFNTADHWNRTHPDEEPIDPDPDGQLARIAAGIDVMLAKELIRHGVTSAEEVRRAHGEEPGPFDVDRPGDGTGTL